MMNVRRAVFLLLPAFVLASAGNLSAQVFVDQVVAQSSRSALSRSVEQDLLNQTSAQLSSGVGVPVVSGTLRTDGAASVGAGAANRVSNSQAGFGNANNVDFSGTANTLQYVQQGNNNAANISVNGSNNVLATTQVGANNSSNFAVSGNANTISNSQSGSGLWIGVSSQGNGASLSIQQNSLVRGR